MAKEEFDVVSESNILWNGTLARHTVAHEDALEVDFWGVGN